VGGVGWESGHPDRGRSKRSQEGLVRPASGSGQLRSPCRASRCPPYFPGRTAAGELVPSAALSSAARWRRRSAFRSSRGDRSDEPAMPTSARAAARRLSTRKTPAPSSVILTMSPACRPRRRRISAGRTSRPRSSKRAVPRFGIGGRSYSHPTRSSRWELGSASMTPEHVARRALGDGAGPGRLRG
jgi:hypothetical protein